MFWLNLINGAFMFFRWVHLLFNLLVQLLVGLPLEMVHGSLRIGVVYMAGVLAGENFYFQIVFPDFHRGI